MYDFTVNKIHKLREIFIITVAIRIFAQPCRFVGSWIDREQKDRGTVNGEYNVKRSVDILEVFDWFALGIAKRIGLVYTRIVTNGW